ncbi:MAG TPA: pyridoxine 5'-phosphate synthase [Salinisphaeraceae bacterium]|nr:pyridoxine 5'-phosphate synthase [Salinisphaeraceae bacterium]
MFAPAASTLSHLRLGVNIDHVATLRQVRGTTYPDVIEAARGAMAAGADGITVHLRIDRRHIQEADLIALANLAQTPVNLEIALSDEMLAIAEYMEPTNACLVPERRAELTTEGGLDVAAQAPAIAAAITRLGKVGIRTALFIDPEPAQIEAAAANGARYIELHTGRYAQAADEAMRMAELQRLAQAASQARALKMEVHAGHGLTTANVAPIAALREVSELNIGHAIVARALFVGLDAAVREMRAAMDAARQEIK